MNMDGRMRLRMAGLLNVFSSQRRCIYNMLQLLRATVRMHCAPNLRLKAHM